MKYTILFIVFAVLSACSGTKSGREDITGTYVNIETDSLRTVYDTLDVRKIHPQATDAYEIVKRSRVVFKKAEDEQFSKANRERINATFDATNNILRTEDPGIVYSVDGNTLVLDKSVYEKIN
ncbi:hypothetical protein [Chitinophaga defluvii]|uniref:Uncharacterized protein n=1 Tax=Chitinophaga defluvii TaxID=3163343 RepID=A0ABV2T8N8_9BACT